MTKNTLLLANNLNLIWVRFYFDERCDFAKPARAFLSL